ncbi:hypothetical protein GPJ56_001556 [Histomonas meleagridis]|uniref:uncharacterized protein n=1 Tax=Histomonas meleagridis TaxID=135588 RepID=UPI00355A1D8E|nr:hypothetical protein GPJ56_001556 [Histomonas meleagridis]KAH0807062.1 hypothetical protein GO595_000238 [Histomonas meleagridis]
MGESSNSEFLVSLLPLTPSDSTRVQASNNNPSQIVKVPFNSTLQIIANYLSALLKAGNNIMTSLHVATKLSTLKVPLTMRVSELFMITGQKGQGKILYNFVSTKAKTPEPKPRTVMKFTPTKIDSPSSPISYPLNSNISRLPLFHSGFSLFSNSFGGFPAPIDSKGYTSPFSSGKVPSQKSINLKNQLEDLLRIK